MTYVDALIRAVGDVEVPPTAESPERDFVHTTIALLGCALARLPQWDRDQYLHTLECGGLREVARQFEGVRRDEDGGGRVN